MSTIQFDKELAKELQQELSPMMYEHNEEPDGRCYYNCHFCKAYCYPPLLWDTKLNEIKHSDDCLGVRTLKELDKRLSEDHFGS